MRGEGADLIRPFGLAVGFGPAALEALVTPAEVLNSALKKTGVKKKFCVEKCRRSLENEI